MIPRVWDADKVIKSVRWLRHQNCEGRNIYIRPKGEHDLSMVDDLTLQAVTAMKEAGYTPAVVVETSPGNYQAWLKHPERLNKEVSTAAARALAEQCLDVHLSIGYERACTSPTRIKPLKAKAESSAD